MISIRGAIAVVVAAGALLAQNPGIQRTVLTRKDLSTPGKEGIVARVEIAPGATSGRHTHPGEEISYMLEGEGEILIDGQPVLKVKPGDAFIVPAGAKHEARNTGTLPMKLSAVFVVEKGQSLATPVP